MNILVLGGTIFLGRSIVDAALARGHELTLFNRGQHHAELYPDVEKLRGDRSSDLTALQGRHWDAVIDTCGYLPRIVQASANLLSSAVEHYTFISTMSVYADLHLTEIDEHSAVGQLEDETTETIDASTYGPLKVLCERAVEQALPGRVLTIRPGLIIGPHDPTDRFTYWVSRTARGGAVLVPAIPNHPVQIIDVRDLADWTVRMVEAHQTGIYNTVGPAYPLTFGQLLDNCLALTQEDTRFTWVDEQFLLDSDVKPWTDLPLWLSSNDSRSRGLFCVNGHKAIDAGLTFRPLSESLHDTLHWDGTRPPDREWRAGLGAEREAELLNAWKHHQHDRGNAASSTQSIGDITTSHNPSSHTAEEA